MKKIKLISLPIAVLLLTVLVSGCLKNDNGPVAVDDPENNNSTSTETNNIPAQGEVDTSDWQTYKNEEYDFKFKYPVFAKPYIYLWDGNYGECESGWNLEQVVPYSVFSLEDEIYLREQYYYERQNGVCNKLENSIGKIKSSEGNIITPWNIKIENIDSKDDISEIVSKNYGETCIYEINKSENLPFDEIIVISDGKSLDDSSCPINYQVHMLVNKEYDYILHWNTGQECVISNSQGICVDNEIVRSFNE